MLASQSLGEKMQNMILKIIMGLITRLLTEKFIARFTVRLLWWLAVATPFKVDDGIVEDIAEGLGVEDFK